MIDILFVPSMRKGNGSGHLSRCMGLASSLGTNAAVFLPDDPEPGCWGSGEIRLAYPRETASLRMIGELGTDAKFRMVVLDNRETTLAELERWSRHGPVIAIDEGGEARTGAGYLVDILPRYRPSNRPGDRPNLASLGFLSLPDARRLPPSSLRRVLVSFGGEDPAGLAHSFLSTAIGDGHIEADRVTVVSGALSTAFADWPGVTAIGPVQDLKEMLRSYDLVITQFGLTAFEAAWAGCAVLLLNPGEVHERLAKAAGFVSLGIQKPGAGMLRRALAEPEMIVRRTQAAAPAERLDLGMRLATLSPRHAGSCPVCGTISGKALYRAERKTCFQCPSCGLVRMASFSARPDPYADKAYFFEEYKAHYGRTYIEDIPTIRLAMARRLGVIEALLPAGNEARGVLDVGCAYGAFVAEAQARGWNAIGTDVSQDAVAFVKENFGSPAFVADFSAAGADGMYPRNLAALTMWYVIEHFDELGRVLRRVGALLEPGGIFAFSTPSIAGVSARKSLPAFLENSPDDHFTVWDPGTAPAILKAFGFKVQRIVVTGHHPERYPGVPAEPRSARYRAMMAVSRLLGRGDTFECYAAYEGRGAGNNDASGMET
jgi:2-polyprenyl-3-methyl-5-hydroxy-6-metoxy-1,4-benzoquinol methylase